MNNNVSIKQIVGISDIHGHLDISIPECDICVCAGDFSPLRAQKNAPQMLSWIEHEFIPWIQSLHCAHFVFISGNHDFICEYSSFDNWFENLLKDKGIHNIHYLRNQSAVVDNVKIFGCPYSDIPGWAFSIWNSPKGYDSIEYDMDILLVHQAPLFEDLGKSDIGTAWEKEFGSEKLMHIINERKPKVCVCGHIHSGSHRMVTNGYTRFYNASILDESYSISYEPQQFIIENN